MNQAKVQTPIYLNGIRLPVRNGLFGWSKTFIQNYPKSGIFDTAMRYGIRITLFGHSIAWYYERELEQSK